MRYKHKNNTKGLTMAIGFIVALSLVITGFEWKVTQKFVKVTKETLTSGTDEVIPNTFIEPPPPPPKKIVIPERIVEAKDEIDLPDFTDIQIEVDITDEWEPVIEITEEKATEYVSWVPEMPEPEGGYEAFYSALAKEIRYPRAAQTIGIEGRVFLEFIVNKDGQITNISTVRGLGSGCDEEAIRALKKINMKWKPGKQGLKKVNVKLTVPIMFKLN